MERKRIPGRGLINSMRLGLAVVALGSGVAAYKSSERASVTQDQINAHPAALDIAQLHTEESRVRELARSLNHRRRSFRISMSEISETPEDCPDPGLVKRRLAESVSRLDFVAQYKEAVDPIVGSLPDGNEVCRINERPVNNQTFEAQRVQLHEVADRLRWAADELYFRNIPVHLRNAYIWHRNQLYLFGALSVTSGSMLAITGLQERTMLESISYAKEQIKNRRERRKEERDKRRTK